KVDYEPYLTGKEGKIAAVAEINPLKQGLKHQTF
ncbi:hypothetical protein C5S53_06975, partial [Methanophagales archaeon]